MILAISDAEKLQMLDLPVALLTLAMGIASIAMRKQQKAARRKRVEKGELSFEEANKKEKTFNLCGNIALGCGIFLLIMWAIRR